MNLLSPLARPLFTWNSRGVMLQAGEGLARFLDVPLVAAEFIRPTLARYAAATLSSPWRWWWRGCWAAGSGRFGMAEANQRSRRPVVTVGVTQ